MADPYARDRATLKSIILARVAAGEPLRAICRAPDLPFDTTVRSWRRADPAFAEALAAAQEQRRVRRIRFDPVRAEAFLARYRTAEEQIDDILHGPGMPTRLEYARWLVAEPPFAEEMWRLKGVMDAIRRERFRRPRRDWDRAIADRVLVRVGRGEAFNDIRRSDPTLPCRKTIDRWRRERPEFASEMAECLRVGRRGRRTRSRRVELTERIVRRLIEGASLHSLSHEPGMPHAATLYRWVRDYPDFAALVDQACDDREDVYLERALELADAATPQTLKAATREIGRLEHQLGRLRNRRGRGGGGVWRVAEPCVCSIVKARATKHRGEASWSRRGGRVSPTHRALGRLNNALARVAQL